jgi:hypothetical protein
MKLLSFVLLLTWVHKTHHTLLGGQRSGGLLKIPHCQTLSNFQAGK